MSASRTEALLESLQTQLHLVAQNAENPLDSKLLHECTIFLVPALDDGRKAALVVQISDVLQKIRGDPTPLVDLLEKIVESFTFAQILAFEPPVDFITGLNVEAQPYNLLFLNLINKATLSPGDAGTLAALPGVIYALVALWLETPDAGIASRAGSVLYELLKVDLTQTKSAGDPENLSREHNLVWRRVFGDKGVYGLILSSCSLRSKDTKLSKREKTIAQGRLMDMVPRLGQLDWACITQSHHGDLESAVGLTGQEGFLDFVCSKMVDTDDVLMHINLIRFYEDLIRTVIQPSISHRHRSASVEFLIDRGLHKKTTTIWLRPEDQDPIDVRFVYGYAALYLGAYASEYPESFLEDTDSVKLVLSRLCNVLHRSPGQWAQESSPSYDLQLLSLLPRACLLPQTWLTAEQGISSPMLRVPSKVTNEDALKALAVLFNPDKQSSTHEWTENRIRFESAAARLLYLFYFSHNPSMFDDLYVHADTVALPEKACTAMSATLSSILSALWTPLPASSSFDSSAPPTSVSDLPSEDQLAAMLPSSSSIPTGTNAQYSGLAHALQTSVKTQFVPWLMRPPRTFGNLIGGRGDAQGAAYQVAMAKFDILALVRNLLADPKFDSPALDNARSSLLEVIQDRFDQGVWGTSSAVGGRIATLEL